MSKVIITMEDYKEIRYKALVEHKSQRQIARELGISRNTVAKYWQGNIHPGLRADYHRDATVVTPAVLQFIQSCFLEDENEPNKKQHHTAKRIYDRLVKEMGFMGGESTIRGAVRELRNKVNEVFVPLAFDAGDAMQIDWGECYVYLAGNRTKINFFCARLCYSCAPFAICYQRQNTESFLEGLIQAFEYFGGVTRRVIFDNAKIAVKNGGGKNAIAQESYSEVAAHYCFEPIFCNVRKGNEKGLVENLVKWTRHNIFVPVPRVANLEELNEVILNNCEEYAAMHQIQGKRASVQRMLQQEKAVLLPLPGIPFDTSKTTECRVSRYATVRFETNAYSVPVQYSGQTVTVKAFAEHIKIYAKSTLVAEHHRCYKREQRLLQLSHYLPILAQKPRSIFQAQPVKQNLSPKLLHVLATTDFSGKELIEVLQFCANHGEQAFWDHKAEFLEHHEPEHAIRDTVQVQAVDLSQYDQFIQKGGLPCQTQG